ncbi:MAG: MBL fold metallo-hydrolase [Gemmatimonadota bacterium]|nr:MBL fold metallo-hydrolase [Gemmatimonadota bacterium]
MTHSRRPRVLASCAVALALGAVSTPLAAQAGLDTVQIRTTSLAGGVYMLTGSGGNIGLAVGDDAVFVVDDQYAPLTPRILAAIAAITDKPVRFVLNTHWHFDHTGGNEHMGEVGALIVAHENVRKRMSAGQFIDALNRQEPAAPSGALPVVTFTDGVTFHINGDSVVVTHVAPAHTDGDALVHFTKANVLHAGDTFITSGLPFVDLSSGGSIHGVIASAEKVIAMTNEGTRIVPGHGAPADRARVRAWRDMLVALRDRMTAEIRAGRTVEQVLAANITAPYLKDWPGGHERFVRSLYRELARR